MTDPSSAGSPPEVPPKGNLGPLTYRLQPWQEEALAAWRASASPKLGPRHGVAEVFTGAGKTILAMACMADATTAEPELRFAIVVPTRAMARQWQRALCKGFGLSEGDIGLRMSGKRGTLASHRIVVYVINSARSALAKDVGDKKVMLVVDECHRAASDENRAIFKARTLYRLGLSATAGRDDLFDKETGDPVPVEKQPHIKAIGPIVYKLDLKRARALGLLPRYVIHHHSLPMTPAEQEKYEELCREVQERKDEARRLGVSPEACRRFCTRPPPHATRAQIAAAQALQAAIFRRKQWLYGVSARNDIARMILVDAAERFNQGGHRLRGLAFNERIDPWEDPDIEAKDARPDPDEDGDDADEDEADDASTKPELQQEEATAGGAAALYERLRSDARSGHLAIPGGESAVAIYHSRLGLRERETALQEFGKGTTSILVSVKALIEGIDVPDANVGISVASTSSGRQRIQTMGRILRAPRDANGAPLPLEIQATMPAKEIHMLYVGATVDEEIYVRANWSDLTGETENKWWLWELREQSLVKLPDDSPPKPPPTEEEAWQAIASGPLPAPWGGSAGGSLWSYRQNSIYSQIDTEAIEPREAVSLLDAASASLGDCRGKFVVTPRLSVVLKKRGDPGGWVALGKLSRPLRAKPRDRQVRAESRVTLASDSDQSPPAAAKATGSSAVAPTLWPALLSTACAELWRERALSAATLDAIAAEPGCAQVLKEAFQAANSTMPVGKRPEALLTKALLTEALATLRTGESDRAAAIALALRDRRDPWCPAAATAIEAAIKSSPPPAVEANGSAAP